MAVGEGQERHELLRAARRSIGLDDLAAARRDVQAGETAGAKELRAEFRLAE